MNIAVFESRHQPLLPRAEFLRRQARYAALALAIVFGSLLLGVVGYHALEGFDWIDALLNASMILGGMGPINELHSTAGKLFASFYALYSGLVVLVAAGVLFAPLLHRILHRFHLEVDTDDADDRSPAGPTEN